MKPTSGYCSLINQQEFQQYLKDSKLSYHTIEYCLKNARILVRKGLMGLSENDFKTEIRLRYKKTARSPMGYAYRRYWEFRTKNQHLFTIPRKQVAG